VETVISADIKESLKNQTDGAVRQGNDTLDENSSTILKSTTNNDGKQNLPIVDCQYQQ
jgi:hypothetical protein